MGTLREAKRRRLDNGGTLEDVVLFRFDGNSCDDCPPPDSFKDLTAINFILGSLGGDGSMTNFEFLRNEMMKSDDMRCVCVWVLKKNKLEDTI